MVRRSLVLFGRLAVLAFAVAFAARTASAQCPHACGCVPANHEQTIAHPDHWNAPAIAMPHSWNAPLALPCAEACPQCVVDCPESCESTGGCFSINGKIAQASETRVEEPAKPLSQAEQIAAWLKKRHNPIVVVAERKKAAENLTAKQEQLLKALTEVDGGARPFTGEAPPASAFVPVRAETNPVFPGIRCFGPMPKPEMTSDDIQAIAGDYKNPLGEFSKPLLTSNLQFSFSAAPPEPQPALPAQPVLADAMLNIFGGVDKNTITVSDAAQPPHGVCPLPFDHIGATTPPDVAATILAGYTEATEANNPPAPLADASSDPHHSHVVLASDEQDHDCPGSTPKSLQERSRIARESAASVYLEYDFTRPDVISRGPIVSSVCEPCQECQLQCRPVTPSIVQIGDEQGDDCPGSTPRRVTILDGAQFPATAEWEALKQVRTNCGPTANPAVQVSDFVQHGPYPVPQVIQNPYVQPIPALPSASAPQSPAPLAFAPSTLSHTATVTDSACQPCFSGQCVSGECDALDAIVRRLERNAPGCINSPVVPQITVPENETLVKIKVPPGSGYEWIFTPVPTSVVKTTPLASEPQCVGCAPGQCATCPGCGPQASYPTTRSVATATQSKTCCGENCACGDTCACGTKTAAAPKCCPGQCDATANCPCGQAANVATCGPTAIVAPRACPYAGGMPAVVAMPDAFFENQQAPVNWPPHPPGSAFGPAPQFATPQYAVPPQIVQQIAPSPYGSAPSYSATHANSFPQVNCVPFDPYGSQPIMAQPFVAQAHPMLPVFRTAGLPAQPKATTEAYQALKESIRQLEKMAADLEEQKLYEQADRLRDSAAELRAKSRAMSSELDALPAESKPAVAAETPPKFGACLPTAEGEKLAWRPNLDCVVPNMICENGICYPVTAPQLPTIEPPKPIMPIAIGEPFPIQTTSEDDQQVFTFVIGLGR